MARIDGVIEITCNGSKGIDEIKKALMAAENLSDGDAKVTVQYLGAPKYRIIVQEEEFKAAEELIRKAASKAISEIEKVGGTGKFERGS